MPALDMVVIGARPSGAATALLAARRGLRVLVVDRARFPSDTLSTNYIHQPGIDRLARWGVLDDIRSSGCPPITSTRFTIGGTVIEGGVSPGAGSREAFAPRRYVLDSIMLDAARRAGAEVREGWSLRDVVVEDGRVVGVVLTDDERKRPVVERCHLVVGADGMRSPTASLVGAPFTQRHPKLTCCYYSFWRGVGGGYELYEGEGAWVGAIPTNDATLVAAYFPQGEFSRVRSSPAAALSQAIEATAPPLAERMRSPAAEQVERLWGTGDQQNFFRQAWGPGWALVGDAAHTKDSITARGITDALMQAELLVSRVWESIGDPASTDARLAEYERLRDDALRPGYRATLDVAQLRVDGDRLARIRDIARDPALSQHYRDAVAGLRSTDGLGLPTAA